jgi:hypothetical protein
MPVLTPPGDVPAAPVDPDVPCAMAAVAPKSSAATDKIDNAVFMRLTFSLLHTQTGQPFFLGEVPPQ